MRWFVEIVDRELCVNNLKRTLFGLAFLTMVGSQVDLLAVEDHEVPSIVQAWLRDPECRPGYTNADTGKTFENSREYYLKFAERMKDQRIQAEFNKVVNVDISGDSRRLFNKMVEHGAAALRAEAANPGVDHHSIGMFHQCVQEIEQAAQIIIDLFRN